LYLGVTAATPWKFSVSPVGACSATSKLWLQFWVSARRKRGVTAKSPALMLMSFPIPLLATNIGTSRRNSKRSFRGK
jgi:hypothetical protein